MTPPSPGSAPGRSLPSSTYRLQLTPDLGFDEARALLPYLADLGVGWIYLSPVLQSAAGSDHGYDVVDPTRIDEARGGQEAFGALCRAAHARGLGVIVDIVPNHQGIATPAENPWWWQLLTLGRDAPVATAFDVDWAAGEGRIVVPVVGDDDVREDGTIARLEVRGDRLRYHEHEFPIAPGTEGDDPQQVHARQHYRLACWREADDRLNYRRFFAVNTLAGIRVEDHDVYERSHAQVARWFREGLVDGLRVDHPDGLRHPGAYLDALHRTTHGGYIVVEKILEGPEELPGQWPVDGTTGYDLLALVDRVLVDPAGEEPLTRLAAELHGRKTDWAEEIHEGKRLVAGTILASEVARLVRETRRLAPFADADESRLTDAFAELLACFGVYRSYLPDGREHLDHALATALRRRPDLGAELDLLAPVLADPSEQVTLRFQQTSGMVMAKGVEDRAFYRWSRLTSLNEVGGDPDEFALPAERFHAAMAMRAAHRPGSMNASSTHDTKRGEDVRARISVLAELPDWWADRVRALQERAPVPDPGFGNLLWQAVVGCWPASRERLHGYAEKAMREAGEHTTWTDPQAGFEDAVHAAVDAAFDDDETRRLVQDAAERLAPYGWSNALAAKLLTLTAPGVPDLYQGSELWEQSLVDPDNRRPVDFARRAGLLERLEAGTLPERPRALDDDGAAKLLLVRTVLRLRRDRPDLFGGYRPVAAHGPAAEHVIAFDRGGLVPVATRLPVGLEARGWEATRLDLAPGRWRDLLTGRTVEDVGDAVLDRILADYPVALLVREER